GNITAQSLSPVKVEDKRAAERRWAASGIRYVEEEEPYCCCTVYFINNRPLRSAEYDKTEWENHRRNEWTGCFVAARAAEDVSFTAAELVRAVRHCCERGKEERVFRAETNKRLKRCRFGLTCPLWLCTEIVRLGAPLLYQTSTAVEM
ncbi:unnamed protein product, partial [Pylaiella littoralis]